MIAVSEPPGFPRANWSGPRTLAMSGIIGGSFTRIESLRRNSPMAMGLRLSGPLSMPNITEDRKYGL